MALVQSSSPYTHLSDTNECLIVHAQSAHPNNVSPKTESKTFERRFTYQKCCLSQEQMENSISYLNKQEELHLWHNHFLVSSLICVLCLIQTIIQIWFIIYTKSPYKWLSTTFLGLSHLVFCLEWVIFVHHLGPYASKYSAVILWVSVAILCPC